MDEDEFYPKSFQEEMNEIMEAFYAMVSEDDIREYQQMIESISERNIAEDALLPVSKSPDFELTDQDGDRVVLRDLLESPSLLSWKMVPSLQSPHHGSTRPFGENQGQKCLTGMCVAYAP